MIDYKWCRVSRLVIIIKYLGFLFQTSSDVLFKDVAVNPAYQPTIPLMRIVREECLIDSDELHGDQRSSKATLDQEKGEQEDMVSVNGFNSPTSVP